MRDYSSEHSGVRKTGYFVLREGVFISNPASFGCIVIVVTLVKLLHIPEVYHPMPLSGFLISELLLLRERVRGRKKG